MKIVFLILAEYLGILLFCCVVFAGLYAIVGTTVILLFPLVAYALIRLLS